METRDSKIIKMMKSSNSTSHQINTNITTTSCYDRLEMGHNTAEGLAGIRYEFFKHLPQESLEFLFYILNKIWINGEFPKNLEANNNYLESKTAYRSFILTKL